MLNRKLSRLSFLLVRVCVRETSRSFVILLFFFITSVCLPMNETSAYIQCICLVHCWFCLTNVDSGVDKFNHAENT